MAEARAVWFLGGRSQSHMKRSENGDRLCFDTRLSRKANQQESGNWTGEFYVPHHTALFISAAAQHPKKNIPARPLPRMAVMMIERLGVRKRKYESATNQQRGGSQQGGPSRIEIVSVAAIFRRLFFMEIVYKTPAFLHVGETGLKFPGDFYILRKFPSRRLPSVVRMDSGWNWTPWMGRSLCWRPMISPSAVSAVISRQSGKVSRFTIREW